MTMNASKQSGYWKQLRSISQSSATNSPSSVKPSRFTPKKKNDHNKQNSSIFQQIGLRLNQRKQKNSKKCPKLKTQINSIIAKKLNRSNTFQTNFADRLSSIAPINEFSSSKRQQNLFQDTLLTVRSFIDKIECQRNDGKLLKTIVSNNQDANNLVLELKAQTIKDIEELHEKYNQFKYEILKNLQQEKLNIQKTIELIKSTYLKKINEKGLQIEYLMTRISELEYENMQLKAQLQFQSKYELKQTAEFYPTASEVSFQPHLTQGKLISNHLIATFGQIEHNQSRQFQQMSQNKQDLQYYEPERQTKMQRKPKNFFSSIVNSSKILNDNSWEKTQILKSFFNFKNRGGKVPIMKTKVDHTLKSETFCKVEALLSQLKNSIKQESESKSHKDRYKATQVDKFSAMSRLQTEHCHKNQQDILNRTQSHFITTFSTINNKMKSSKSCHQNKENTFFSKKGHKKQQSTVEGIKV